jgi:nitrate reductase (NAD(P)H)
MVLESAALTLAQRLKAAGQDVLSPHFSTAAVKSTEASNDAAAVEDIMPPMTKPGVTRQITMAELEAQDKTMPWFVVNGEVYDGTPFLKDHPGGADSISLVAGEDASEDFMAIHSADGKAKLAEVSHSGYI